MLQKIKHVNEFFGHTILFILKFNKPQTPQYFEKKTIGVFLIGAKNKRSEWMKTRDAIRIEIVVIKNENTTSSKIRFLLLLKTLQ